MRWTRAVFLIAVDLVAIDHANLTMMRAVLMRLDRHEADGTS
jgi:hypothetical protein